MEVPTLMIEVSLEVEILKLEHLFLTHKSLSLKCVENHFGFASLLMTSECNSSWSTTVPLTLRMSVTHAVMSSGPNGTHEHDETLKYIMSCSEQNQIRDKQAYERSRLTGYECVKHQLKNY